MRIALFTDGIYPYVIGGMQKHSYYLAKYMARAKVNVDLYHFNKGEKDITALELFSEEEKQFIRAFDIGFPSRGNFPGHYIRESFAYSCKVYASFLQNGKVDYVYAKGFSAWKLLDAKRKGEKHPPVGVNFHGLEMFQEAPDFKSQLKQFLLRSPARFCLEHADHTFSYGGKITPLLMSLGVVPSKIIEIPTGIEEDWLRAAITPPESLRRFIFVGRYERRKGIEELNEVLKHIQGRPFSMNFVGPISSDRQLKLPGISYSGSVLEAGRLRELLGKADVLVCPSHSEGMPNVIMEAMAQGLAVIATDVGAVSEMVGPENGWLIPARSQEALKQAMLDAISAPADELLFKKECSQRKVRENFLWEKLIGVTLRKITDTISRI